MQQQYQPREDRALVELLGRALIDPEFRKQLETNPEQTASSFKLSPDAIQKLKQMDSGKLDEAAGQLAGRSEWRIFIGISGHFNSTQ
jgi:hypothetical protein